jgi:hypothetical protein
VAAEEKRAASETFRGALANGAFGAGGIGDERVRRSGSRDFGQMLEDGSDGQRDVNKIGAADGASEIRFAAIDRSAFASEA